MESSDKRQLSQERERRARRELRLSFDDGPSGFTPAILERLASHQARAAFFMVGCEVERHPQIARRVAEAGHEVGNHTYHHRNLVKLSAEEVRAEVLRSAEAIERATGGRPRLVRPPFGAVNEIVIDVVAEEGFELFDWDNDPRDWERPGAEVIARRVLEAPGNVPILHDGGGDRSQTVEAVGLILAAVSG